MIYLIVAGSLVAYSAYVWLLRWVSSSKAIVGAVLALISVFIILAQRTS
jgi:drug/metabolite transporter (DMT)-like permease